MSSFILQSSSQLSQNNHFQYEIPFKNLQAYAFNIHKALLQILSSQTTFIKKDSNVHLINKVKPIINQPNFDHIISESQSFTMKEEILSDNIFEKSPYMTVSFQIKNNQKKQIKSNFQQTWQVFITKFAKIYIKISFNTIFQFGLIGTPNLFLHSSVMALSRYLNLKMTQKLMTFKVHKSGQIILESDVPYSLINHQNKSKLKKQIVKILKAYQQSAQIADDFYAKLFVLNSKEFKLNSLKNKNKQSEARKKISSLKDIFQSNRKYREKSTLFNHDEINQKNKLKQFKNAAELLCRNDFLSAIFQIGQTQYVKEIESKSSTVDSEHTQKMELQKNEKVIPLSSFKQPDDQSIICSGVLFLQRIPGQFRYEFQHTLGLSVVSIRNYVFNIFQTVNFPNKQFCVKNKKQAYLFNKTAIMNKIQSMNSVGNQIQFVNFIRSQSCKYIGKYYLLINDPALSIYMKVYRLSLEYIIGQTQTKLKASHKIQIAIDIIKGIQHLSCQGICHRDLKPGNVMLTENLKVKLIDFGSATFAHGEDDHNIPRLPLLSTPKYYQKYAQLPNTLQDKFTKKQYYQHIFFDSFSFGQILSQVFQLFDDDIQKDRGAPSQVIEQLKWIKGKCKQLNPQDRLSPSMILRMLEAVQQLLNQSPFFNTQ